MFFRRSFFFIFIDKTGSTKALHDALNIGLNEGTKYMTGLKHYITFSDTFLTRLLQNNNVK